MDTKLIEFDKWWEKYQNFYPKPKELGKEAFVAGMLAAADIVRQNATLANLIRKAADKLEA